MKLLENKSAIITGATRGIGKGIAVEFAKQGANVAFTYSSSVEAANALEEELKTYFNKIYDTIQEMADSTLEELTKNGIDIMTKEDFNSLEDEQNRGWTQGLFILLLISFGSSTLNNIFNILPKFSFLESFGLLLLLINVYSLISIYLFKK